MFVGIVVDEITSGTERFAAFVTLGVVVSKLVFPSSWHNLVLLPATTYPSFMFMSLFLSSVVSKDIVGDISFVTFVTFWMELSILELPSSWETLLLLPAKVLFSFHGKTSYVLFSLQLDWVSLSLHTPP